MSALDRTISDVIREFDFGDFGMDDVDIALHDDPDAQEWVPALAEKIGDAVRGVLGAGDE